MSQSKSSKSLHWNSFTHTIAMSNFMKWNEGSEYLYCEQRTWNKRHSGEKLKGNIHKSRIKNSRDDESVTISIHCKCMVYKKNNTCEWVRWKRQLLFTHELFICIWKLLSSQLTLLTTDFHKILILHARCVWIEIWKFHSPSIDCWQT